MLAITFKRPPQRVHGSISIPNTRLRRRAQVMRTAWEVGRSGVAARWRALGPLPAGVIAARSAACGFFYNPDVPESRECYDVIVRFFANRLGKR